MRMFVISLIAFMLSQAFPGAAQADGTAESFEYLRLKNAPATDEINSFTTDDCSQFPEGVLSDARAWRHCCVAHDLKYWAGGTYEERLAADRELRACVAEAGFSHIAQMMYLGVRYGGQPDTLAPWRWGYGWPYAIGYAPLTETQRLSVERKKSEYLNGNLR